MFDLMGMPSLSATMDEYFSSQNEEVDILPPDLPTTNPMDSHYALNVSALKYHNSYSWF